MSIHFELVLVLRLNKRELFVQIPTFIGSTTTFYKARNSAIPWGRKALRVLGWSVGCLLTRQCYSLYTLQDMTSLFKKILDLTYPFTSMFSGEIFHVVHLIWIWEKTEPDIFWHFKIFFPFYIFYWFFVVVFLSRLVWCNAAIYPFFYCRKWI